MNKKTIKGNSELSKFLGISYSYTVMLTRYFPPSYQIRKKDDIRCHAYPIDKMQIIKGLVRNSSKISLIGMLARYEHELSIMQGNIDVLAEKKAKEIIAMQAKKDKERRAMQEIEDKKKAKTYRRKASGAKKELKECEEKFMILLDNLEMEKESLIKQLRDLRHDNIDEVVTTNNLAMQKIVDSGDIEEMPTIEFIGNNEE